MKENADKARALDAAELNKQLRDTAEQRFRLRFQMSMGQMEGLKKYRALRKERARMLTVLRERELKLEPAAKSPAAPSKAKSAPVANAKRAVKVKAASKPSSKPAAKNFPKGSAKPAGAQKARKSSKG